MILKDLILAGILILILPGAGLYVYRAKKRGNKCIGCPYANACSKKNCNNK